MPTAVPDPARGETTVWTFSPRPRPRFTRDETVRFRGALDAAFRAGHGAGVSFQLQILGGPESSLLLSAQDAGTQRWVERSLLRVYAPGDWRRTTASVRPTHPTRWSGRRDGLPGEHAEPPVETGRLLRALASTLRSCGAGTALTVGLRPAPPPRFRFLDPWLRWEPPVPNPARRPGGKEPPVASAGRGAVAPPPSLLWSADLELVLGTLADRRGAVGALAAVSTGWTALDGRRLVLREATRRPFLPGRTLLSDAELPALFPAIEDELYLPIVPESSDAGLPLGRTAAGSAVALPVEARQGRHFAIVGETGMGKSSLLVSLARRAARLGGLILLDPLGETAEAVRQRLLVDGREVTWVAPGVPRNGANALAAIGTALQGDPVRAERGVEDLVHALRRVRAGRYADSSYWGPRLEEMMVRAVRAAASVPGGTLEDAHALLAGAGAGRSVVPPSAQAAVRELAGRVRDRPDDAEGARRLLYEIVRNPTLAGMLCAREPDVSIPELVAPGRVVLVSGGAALVGESTARYLLAAYLALLWAELLGRPTPAKTFVLLDEAQWFAHEGLGEMLRLARRRNVHVGVATQGLSSLPEEVRDAVRTNVADLVVFRGSPDEALALGRTTSGVSAEALMGLSRGEAAVLLGKGETVRWVRTARWPDLDGPRPGAALSLADPALRPGAEGPRPLGLPTEAPEPASSPAVPEPFEEEPFIAEVLARARALAPGELLEIDVADVRVRQLADERRIRAWGGELGRRGAILRRERRETGPVWWVDPLVLTQGSAVDGRPGHRAVAASQKPL